MDHQSFLPLQEPTYFILLCLTQGEKHGYAIMKEVSELSARRIRLSTGTLYGALNRLLDQGLIRQVEGTGPRGKKAYQLERMGLEVFEADQERMRQLLQAAQHKMEGRVSL